MRILAIDKNSARRAFERAAEAYDEVAVLQREIADRMLERLDYVRLEPATILDLGAGTGYAVAPLQLRYRGARVLAVDFALNMVREARRRGSALNPPQGICGDAEALPLADASVDLVFSNATLQWCTDIERTFGELLRVLRPGGLLMFSTFGPDTLMELRAAWAAVDGYSHVNHFIDMHDLGDALVRARFADPVMDAERITLTFDNLRGLMRELKLLGAHNVTAERSRGLTGRQRLDALVRAYEVFRRDGRLPATYEVLYGHAWVPEQKPIPEGVAVPLSAIRRLDRT